MSYPTTLDSFTAKTDTVDDVLAADWNSLAAAIAAIEAELGTLPKGAYADVKARLAALATPSSPLTPSSLHATFGDDFTASSLNTSKWTRVTYTSGDETPQAGGGSFLQIAPRAAGAYYYQSSSGSGTAFSLVGKFIVQSVSGTNAFGLLATDSSGNGGACSMYTSSTTIDGAITLRVTAGVFNTTFTQTLVTGGGTVARAGTPYWLRLNYNAGVFSCQYSLNGALWSDTSPTVTPTMGSLARVGFGGVQGTVSKVAIDWFDLQ